MPIQPRVAPSDAESVITDFLQYLQIVSLDGQDYQSAIACMVALNIPGGGVFDALIAQAALKFKSIFYSPSILIILHNWGRRSLRSPKFLNKN
ncbi:MAG: hypothetical protein V7L00_31695 [Nostoc sp.]|uniref:hypothetical protein n=1 Tax=Nostoc sp. TaxID=1180 RepID=UPI002FF87409